MLSAYATKGGTAPTARKSEAAIAGTGPAGRRVTGAGPGACGSLQAAAVRRPGQPLEPAARRDFERHFGRDFSAVRLHADGETQRAAKAVGARAYTLGRHIALRDGLDTGSTPGGRRLMLHELTHVVQQAAFPDHTLRGARVLDADHRSEREASAGGSGAITPLRAPAVQCDREQSPEETSIGRQDELLEQIEREIASPAAGKTGQDALAGVFDALDPSYATMVDNAVAAGRLRGFNQLPRSFRDRLRAILADRRAAVPRLTPGVWGRGVARLNESDYFIVRYGVTVGEVARYLSDDPALVDVLEKLNNLPRDRMLASGTQVYFPKRLTLRPRAAWDRLEALRSGSFIEPWGAQKVVHSGQRSLGSSQFGVGLTESEFASIKENQREQEELPKGSPSDPGKQLEQDFKRAAQLPNPVLTLFFPTSRLYVRDQAPLIRSELARFAYQSNMRAFDAGTNLNRAAGVVGAAIEVTPMLVLDAAALGELAAEAGLGKLVLYGSRALYLTAPVIAGDLALYSGAALTGIALAEHLQKVRTSGFDRSDIPRLAEDLLPFFSGWSESNFYRTSTGNTPAPAPAPSAGAPARPSLLGRWLQRAYLSFKLTVDDVVPESNISSGSSGKPVAAQVESAPRTASPDRPVATPAPVSTAPHAADAPTSATPTAPAGSPVTPESAPGPGLGLGGYQPLAGERSVSREQWKAFSSGVRSENTLTGAFSESSPFAVGELTAISRPRRPREDDAVPSYGDLGLDAAQERAASRILGTAWNQDIRQTWRACDNALARQRMAEVQRLWNLGTDAARRQAKDLARATFDQWVRRFWARIQRSPNLRGQFTAAGLRVSSGRAPYYRWADGFEEGVTIEHWGSRLSDDPTRAVDETNLMFSMRRENVRMLEGIRAGSD